MSGLIIIRFDNDGGLRRSTVEITPLSKYRHATMNRALWSVFMEHSTITAEIFSMGSAWFHLRHDPLKPERYTNLAFAYKCTM